MPLPKMSGIKEVIIPAQEQKIFNDGFLKNLIINASPDTKWNASIQLQSFNYDTNELGPEIDTLVIRDLLAESLRCPTLGQCMGFVLQVVGYLALERKALKKLEEANALPDEDPEKAQKVSDAETALSEVKVLLGIT